MLLIQVVLGGVTRLTGSGLSITEWNIPTNTIPPLNEHQWLIKFEKYKQTPQFRLLNADFTLSDFKFIYFWEWFHRLWANFIAVVFLVGFIFLISKKYLKKEMQVPLLILFLLGALQAVIGKIMVASGLTGDEVYVKPTRLAMHFVFALVLISYAFWFALQLLVPAREKIVDGSLRNLILLLLGLLFFQLIFGALMAGHKAATVAPTWPDINGSIVPDGLFSHNNFLLNFIENKITIHFVHRMLAYLLAVISFYFTWKAWRTKKANVLFNKVKWLPLVLILIQILLGIFTVVTSPGIVPNRWAVFEWMAQLHQFTGMLYMLSLITVLYLVRQKSFAV